MTYPDETEVLLESSAQHFLAHEFKSERLRKIYNGTAAYDRDFWVQLAEQGWLSLRLPENLDGSGLTVRHLGIVANAFGRHAVPEPFVACSLVPAVLAAELAIESRWDNITSGLIDGSYIVTLAWQEHSQQLDGAPQSVVATTQGDNYAITGTKYGVVAARWADALLVSAQLDENSALFLIPRDTSGMTIDEHVTSDGGTVATVCLQDVKVAEQSLLAQGTDLLRAMSLARDEATLVTAVQLTGMATAALEITLDYLRTRVQFDRVIGSFQSLQHMAVDVRIQQALARAACRSAERCHETAPSEPATRQAIAAAKARASDAALTAGRFGVQAHGAIGYAAEAEIGLYLKGALRLAAYWGTSAQNRKRYGELADAAPRENSQ
ncbi:MAG TPA: acyl-CoA dehydrogenase family protein [Eoetvoesiella sp.]